MRATAIEKAKNSEYIHYKCKYCPALTNDDEILLENLQLHGNTDPDLSCVRCDWERVL